jgi:flagellar biosynthesis protein FliP
MEPIVLWMLLVIVFSAFIKIATTLTVFRYGIGLHGVEFGLVSLVLALVISWTTMPIPMTSLDPRILGGEQITMAETQTLLNTLIPHLEKNIDGKVLEAVTTAAAKKAENLGKKEGGASTLEITLPAYVISEVKRALTLGITLLIPFVLLDLLVAHFLTLLGIQQLAVATVALPLKLIVFLSVSGWELLLGKLIS